MDIIFDIDGTLADLTHRLHLVKCQPKNWDAFFASVHQDQPIEPVVMIQQLILTGIDQWATSRRIRPKMILCSGRSEVTREATEQWLLDNEIFYDALYMRKAKDTRADDIVKKEMLDQIIADGYDPVIAFDDRDRVVKMWRDNGLICCQVAPGKF